MTVELRMELIFLAVVFFIIIIKNINARKLQLQFSLYWILAAAVLFLFAIFPDIVYFISGIIGIKTPSNFIFFACIIWLIAMNLFLTIIISKQAEKIKEIIQKVSLENYKKEHKDI